MAFSLAVQLSFYHVYSRPTPIIRFNGCSPRFFWRSPSFIVAGGDPAGHFQLLGWYSKKKLLVVAVSPEHCCFSTWMNQIPSNSTSKPVAFFFMRLPSPIDGSWIKELMSLSLFISQKGGSEIPSRDLTPCGALTEMVPLPRCMIRPR